MLNDAAIRNTIIVIAGLALMVIGVAVIASSKKAQFSEVAKTGVNSMVGIILLAAGAGALVLVTLGQRILDTLFVS